MSRPGIRLLTAARRVKALAFSCRSGHSTGTHSPTAVATASVPVVARSERAQPGNRERRAWPISSVRNAASMSGGHRLQRRPEWSARIGDGPMRVALISSSDDPYLGGVEEHTRHLAGTSPASGTRWRS